MDETFFTIKKGNRSSFRGRLTCGQQCCISGMVELDIVTTKDRGALNLLKVAEPTRALVEEQVRAHGKEGSLIFADSHRS
eukprot:9349417-Karenia_brevis.AAC.1